MVKQKKQKRLPISTGSLKISGDNLKRIQRHQAGLSRKTGLSQIRSIGLGQVMENTAGQPEILGLGG
jgi:hypothetical protein